MDDEHSHWPACTSTVRTGPNNTLYADSLLLPEVLAQRANTESEAKRCVAMSV